MKTEKVVKKEGLGDYDSKLMSIARACYVSIMPLFQTILSFIRSLCGGSRSNKRVDMDEMPFEVVVDKFGSHKGEERASLLNNADSWDNDDWDKKEEVNEKIEQWRQTNQQKPEANAAAAEDDLFSILEPTITSARKVVVKPKGFQPAPQQPKRSLFEFNEESIGATSTLEEIDDDLMAWGDDLDITLKEHRNEQNKQRQVEHERRLHEKKLNQPASSNFL